MDIDKEDLLYVNSITGAVKFLHSSITNREYKILASIPSKSGIHIITNPFNLAEFTKAFPSIEVHKNNPTNLYIPTSTKPQSDGKVQEEKENVLI
jgi:hypothetical protein